MVGLVLVLTTKSNVAVLKGTSKRRAVNSIVVQGGLGLERGRG
ncbi:hypothetical protein [Streptomyces sp. SD15]